MDLWQVRKEYRRVAARLRRRDGGLDPHVRAMEERLLVGIASCDRYETELGVLRLARRCARARLRRLRQWVENAALLQTAPLSLSRKPDELAAEELERVLTRASALEAARAVRQVMDELSHLDRRLAETKERIGRIVALTAESFDLLRLHSLALRSGERVGVRGSK